MIKTFKGCWPSFADNVYVAPGSFVIGNVVVGEKSSIWFNTVVRGDIDMIIIGEESNIQDNATLHTDTGYPVTVGNRVTVGHNAVLHGCTIGDDVLVGMGAIVLNGATVGEGAIIGAGSLVKAGAEIPPYTLAVGSPAKVVRELEKNKDGNDKAPYKEYMKIAEAYRKESI